MGVDAPFIGAEGLLMYKVYSTLSTARLSLGNLPDPEGHLGISPYCTTPPASGLDVVGGGGALPRPTPAFRPFPSSEGPPFRRPGVSFPSGPSREGTVPGVIRSRESSSCPWAQRLHHSRTAVVAPPGGSSPKSPTAALSRGVPGKSGLSGGSRAKLGARLRGPARRPGSRGSRGDEGGAPP